MVGHQPFVLLISEHSRLPVIIPARDVKRGGADRVIGLRSGLGSQELADLLPLISFETSTPDPVLVWMIDNTEDDAVLKAAWLEYISYLAAWSGSRVPITDLFLEYGIPEHIRSDNGPEFVAKAVRGWLSDLGVTTLFIEPGSPWENGYIESFNSKLRDELLDGELFYTLKEAQILIAGWRRLYKWTDEWVPASHEAWPSRLRRVSVHRADGHLS
jgi:transposase InsO family protein